VISDEEKQQERNEMSLHEQTAINPNDLDALLASLSAAEDADASHEGQVEVTAPAQPAEVDELALLAELEGLTGEVDDEILADLEATTARAEAYEAQVSSAAIATPAEVAKKDKKSSAARVSKGARAPKVALENLPEEVFARFVSEKADKTATLALRPTQIKVAEKFDNLFCSLHAKKVPSRYVVTAFNLLKKMGTMTSADLMNAYRAENLNDGTASSQAGQIMVLFNAVGVADRQRQTLKLREDSVIGARLSEILTS
jgi:hypothetical protein